MRKSARLVSRLSLICLAVVAGCSSPLDDRSGNRGWYQEFRQGDIVVRVDNRLVAMSANDYVAFVHRRHLAVTNRSKSEISVSYQLHLGVLTEAMAPVVHLTDAHVGYATEDRKRVVFTLGPGETREIGMASHLANASSMDAGAMRLLVGTVLVEKEGEKHVVSYRFEGNSVRSSVPAGRVSRQTD